MSQTRHAGLWFVCYLKQPTSPLQLAQFFFLEWWSFSKKLRQSEGERFFRMTSTTHTATGITPTVTENIITDKNGLLMGSHSTVVVRGVNKQKLRLRAAAVSLRGTHQCHVEGRRLNEARVLSPELRVGNVHLCVSLHICRPFDRHRAGCPRVDLNKRSCCCHILDGLCTKSRLLQPVPVVFLCVSARWCGAVSEASTPLMKKNKKKSLLWNAALFYSVKRIKINHSPTEHRQKDNWINQNDINHAFQSLLSFFFFFCWEQTVLQVFSSADSEGGRKLKAEKWQNATAYI